MSPRFRSPAVRSIAPHARFGPGAIAVALAATLAAAGCSGDDDDVPDVAGPGGGDDVPVLTGEADYTLQLLHFSDIDGTGGALDDVDAFSALVDFYRAASPDVTLLLSSGDNFIPGPRYAAADDDSLAPLLGIPGAGRGDIAFLNALGVSASAVGNHDLDAGTEELAGLIAPGTETDDDTGETSSYAGAAFPYLSSNLDFSADESLAPLAVEGGRDVAGIAGKVAPSTTVEVGGETLGVVGASTPALASITDVGGIVVRPGDATDVDALAADIQQDVDALVARGIDKIVLVSHMQQLSIERALAARLSNVDIIVGGGSNTLLADVDDVLRTGDVAADTYPLEYRSASGEPVLLVNTDGDYKYLGRLEVGFDADGRVLNGELDGAENGAQAATAENAARLGAVANARVAEISAALRDVLLERDGDIAGRTDVYLDGRRGQVRTEETNLGDLTADANLWLARQSDATTAISLKNGGGIRAPIGIEVQPPGTVDPGEVEFLPPPANADTGKAEGDVSRFDLETALRFNNGLALVTVTAAELKDLLEHGVAATEAGATPGQFPQVGGLAFSFDPSLPARVGGDTSGAASVPGERVRELAILDGAGDVVDSVVRDGAIGGDATRAFRLVILDFMAECADGAAAECGDGYPLKGLAAPDLVRLTEGATDPGRSDFAPIGSEQEALAEYLAEFHPAEGGKAFDEAETPAAKDARIRNLASRQDGRTSP